MSGGVYRITDGVLLTGSAIDTTLYAINAAQWYRGTQGLPPSRRLAALRRALAAPGQSDSDDEPDGQAGREGEVVAVAEAAELLGCSSRTARRLAPELGGRMVAGTWILDRQAVIEHIEGRQRR